MGRAGGRRYGGGLGRKYRKREGEGKRQEERKRWKDRNGDETGVRMKGKQRKKRE